VTPLAMHGIQPCPMSKVDGGLLRL